MSWSERARAYISARGWVLDENGVIVLTGKQYQSYQHTGRSIRDSSVRTLLIPTEQGSTLILERKHFRIQG